MAKGEQNTDHIPEEQRLDAVVIGAGFGGLYALYRFIRLAHSMRVKPVES
jgi:cation diffusion facilitator CzcD-associated flavoprotein CzcO